MNFQCSDRDYVNNIINTYFSQNEKWLISGRLFRNCTKTKILIFNSTSKKCDFNVMINGFNIEQSEIIKNLGVVLDDNLNWYAQILFGILNRVY